MGVCVCVGCGVWCGVWCSVPLFLRAGGVLFKTRTQYQGVLGKNTPKPEKKNILAKCPNTVRVLHRENVVLGVVLSCCVVLGSRVVLCCVYL